MKLGKKFKELVVVFLFINSCGFTPECPEPGAQNLSYPVDGIIRDAQLFVLNSDENFDYCSSFISVFKIDGENLEPLKVILPENPEDFLLAGRIISADERIFVTERGKGMIFVFSKEGDVLEKFEEGGNPYDIIFIKGESENWLVTANLKTNTVTIYTAEKIQKIKDFPYPYPPVSMVYNKDLNKIFVGFSASSDMAVISLDPEAPYPSETTSISPDGNISSIKNLSLYRDGIYAVMENPSSLVFVEANPPFYPRLLYLFRERIFSVEIIEEKNLLLALSPLGDTIYGFSINPFLFLWKIEVKGNPVIALYSEKSGLIYIIPMMEKKIKILNPETLELK